jgi:ADP-heptose:LPS heptosyltransferase
LGENFIGYQLKNIGDALMCLPALGLIKREIKDSRVTLVVRPPAAPFLKGIPFVDEVLTAGHDTKKWSLSVTLDLRKKIARKKYSFSYGFDHKRRSGILSLISGQKERLSSVIPGYEKPSWPWRTLDDRVLFGGEAPVLPNLIHMSERQGRLVAASLGISWRKGLDPDLIPPLPPLSDEVLEKARNLLRDVQGEGPYVGLCLRGLQPEKSFPLQKVSELARALRAKKDARLFMTGLPGDRPLLMTIRALSGEDIADFTGKTDLMDLLAIGTMTDLFVSVDTGAAHLVSWAGAPVLCVYTASNPAMWAPFGEKKRLLCYTWATSRFGLPVSPPEGTPFYESFERVGPSELREAALSLL